MANLSVPSPGKWISDILGENTFRPCFEKMNLRWLLWPKCQVKKVSYIDPLVMRFSLKSQFSIGHVHHFFTFFGKPYFRFLQYRKSVLKKTLIFGPLFEPCSSCVAVDSFFFQKKTISGKQRPPKRVNVRQFLSKCPNVDFFWEDICIEII